MSAGNRQRAKQYMVTAGAGAIRPVPEVSNLTFSRTLLVIQNTGVNYGVVHFGEAVQENGSDFIVLAGETLSFTNPDTCPNEAINFQSPDGTTFAVLEGVSKEGA